MRTGGEGRGGEAIVQCYPLQSLNFLLRPSREVCNSRPTANAVESKAEGERRRRVPCLSARGTTDGGAGAAARARGR